MQSLLFICVVDLHGFGYTRLRKIINVKKIVRFTTWKSVICNFWARSSEIVLWKNCALFTQLSVYIALSGM